MTMLDAHHLTETCLFHHISENYKGLLLQIFNISILTTLSQIVIFDSVVN